MNVLSPDNSVYLKAIVQNPVTGLFVNDATVKANIYDNDNVLVAGTWPQTLSYVAASDGVYQTTLDPITGLVIGAKYRIQYFSTDPSTVVADCDLCVKATDRAC